MSQSLIIDDERPLAERPLAEQSRGCVLVVDDIEANLRLLNGVLRVAGYESLNAASGAEALALLETQRPDVVLLDVMMPGMDGFEVCRRIRANPATATLPVVVVTALQETEHRVAALEAGADDFLTKPVDATEVAARLHSLVRVKRQREELERAYAELRRAEELRDSLTAMLVHDLRTPLTSIMGVMNSLRMSDHVLDQFQSELLEIGLRSGRRLLAMVNDLLDVGKLESGQMKLRRTEVRIASLLDEVLEQARLLHGGLTTEMPPADAPLAAGEKAKNGARIETNLAAELPVIRADADLLQRVLINLVANAIKFTPPAGVITIAARRDGRELLLSVRDQGHGIAAEDQQRIFEKFGQVEISQSRKRMSTGLGLTFCKLAVEAHGGRVWVQSEVGAGSTFYLSLPVE